MKLFLLLLTAGGMLLAQTTTVAVSKESPNESVETLTFYDSNNVPQYICKAKSRQALFAWRVTPSSIEGTLTSIVVSTNVGTVTTSTAHGLQPNNRINVVGSTTAALNGTYVVKTVGSTTTFTITTSGVGDATYNTSGLGVTTNAARSSAAMWLIEKFTNTGVGNAPVADQFAEGSTSQTNICDNRATIAYQ